LASTTFDLTLDELIASVVIGGGTDDLAAPRRNHFEMT
jgi:hypothetical protein